MQIVLDVNLQLPRRGGWLVGQPSAEAAAAVWGVDGGVHPSVGSRASHVLPFVVRHTPRPDAPLCGACGPPRSSGALSKCGDCGHQGYDGHDDEDCQSLGHLGLLWFDI